MRRKNKKYTDNPEPKPGDIVINHCHKKDIARSHPLLQYTKGRAFILTTKEFPRSGDKTLKINEEDCIDFKAKSSFVTDRVVSNTQGRKIGNVKKSFLEKITHWISNK